MRIGELATAAGVSRDTLRFYEQRGLIRSRRLDNGYRDYPQEVLMLVHYIRTAQQLGFTLVEIGHRLPDIWEAPDPGPAVAQVLQEKLLEIDARIDALQALRGQLAERLAVECPLVGGSARQGPPRMERQPPSAATGAASGTPAPPSPRR